MRSIGLKLHDELLKEESGRLAGRLRIRTAVRQRAARLAEVSKRVRGEHAVKCGVRGYRARSRQSITAAWAGWGLPREATQPRPNCGSDASSAPDPLVRLFVNSGRPTWGAAAGQGARPTKTLRGAKA
jgi:hypothetical protein